MKAAAITTVRHNVGDDFVREGLMHLIEQVTGPAEWALIHKHLPATARKEWEWLHHPWLQPLTKRAPERISKIVERLPLPAGTDKILGSDLVVQCGAPILWKHELQGCESNEWFGPLIRRRRNRMNPRPPFLNLGGGTCQAYSGTGREFDHAPETLAYMRELADAATLTTARDELTRVLFRKVGRELPLLACPSLWARDRWKIEARAPQYVALNFMPIGGHYDFGQRIDPAHWTTVFRQVASELHRSHPCVLACHNAQELAAAHRWLPDIPVFYSPDFRDYLSFYAAAKWGVVNRVHAAFAMASFARPSIVIGADTRSHMVDLIGGRRMFVKEASYERLLHEVLQLPALAQSYEEVMRCLRQKTEERYIQLIAQALRLP